MIIDASTGGIRRQVPGTDRQTDHVADAVVGPDLRSLYLPGRRPQRGLDLHAMAGPRSTWPPGRRPAFGGLTGVGEFSLSADGQTLAYLHTSAPSAMDRRSSCATPSWSCELASGRQQVWTIPGGSVQGLQLSPDATRLVYLLAQYPAGTACRICSRSPGPPRSPTARPTGGRRLPDVDVAALDDRRLLALGCVAEPFDNLLVRFDLDTRRVLSTLPLGLPVEPFSLDVDRSGRHVLLAAAGKPNDQRPATAYLLRDGRPQRCRSLATASKRDW